MSTGGSETAGTTGRIGQFSSLDEGCVLDFLDDQLCDAVAALDVNGLAGIVVDEEHRDLTAVSGVDRAGRVHHGQSVLDGQAGAWMDERRMTVRECDSDAGGDHGPLPRRQCDVDGAAQVGTSIAGLRVGRQRHTRIESGDENLFHAQSVTGTPNDLASPVAWAGPRSLGAGGAWRSPPYSGAVESYRERLTVPASWWVVALIFGGTCGWLMVVAASPSLGVAAAIVGTVAAGALIWGYGSLTVCADARGLKVGGAHLDAAHIGTVTPLDRAAFRTSLGPDTDARAWLRTRPYVDGGVRVDVNDPSDPVPYWLVSCRRPEAVAAALGRPVGQTVPHCEKEASQRVVPPTEQRKDDGG